MSAISTIPRRTEQLAILLRALLPGAVANGGASSAAAALERLRWADEVAAIDAEDVLMQAEEALCLG